MQATSRFKVDLIAKWNDEVESINQNMMRVFTLLRAATDPEEMASIIDTCDELRECMAQLGRSHRVFFKLGFDSKEWGDLDEWEARAIILERLFDMVRNCTARQQAKMVQWPKQSETVFAPRPFDIFYSLVRWLLGE
jgi:hypothetical protein